MKSLRPSGQVAATKAVRTGVTSARLPPANFSTLNTTAVELTKTSRAANDVMRPMPMRQSKPSGLIVGSMRWPARPAKLCAICCDGVAAGSGCLGYAVRNQSTMEMPRMIVPAFLRNSQPRSTIWRRISLSRGGW